MAQEPDPEPGAAQEKPSAAQEKLSAAQEKPSAAQEKLSAAQEKLSAAQAETLNPEPRLQHEDPRAKALRLRRQRAERGLRGAWIVRSTAPDAWRVITHPESEGYIIRRVAGELTCNCPDFTTRDLGACKHTLAVEMVLAEQAAS
jgi:hypothetical protein